jgi:hypothetical protein
MAPEPPFCPNGIPVREAPKIFQVLNDFVSVSLRQIQEQISEGICPGHARHERLFVRRLERARDIRSTSSWEVMHRSRMARSDSSIMC